MLSMSTKIRMSPIGPRIVVDSVSAQKHVYVDVELIFAVRM